MRLCLWPLRVSELLFRPKDVASGLFVKLEMIFKKAKNVTSKKLEVTFLPKWPFWNLQRSQEMQRGTALLAFRRARRPPKSMVKRNCAYNILKNDSDVLENLICCHWCAAHYDVLCVFSIPSRHSILSLMIFLHLSSQCQHLIDWHVLEMMWCFWSTFTKDGRIICFLMLCYFFFGQKCKF